MVIILELGHIQVKRKIVRIDTGICREGRRSFRDQEQKNFAQLVHKLVD